MQFIQSMQTKMTTIRTSTVQLAYLAQNLDFAAVAKDVDGFCSKHVNNVVEFLDKHPGISMALSPTAVLRRCAQKHVERQTGCGIRDYAHHVYEQQANNLYP